LRRLLSILVLAIFILSPATALNSNTLSTTSPDVNQGGATVAEAYASYEAGNTAWNNAWGASDFGLIRQYLNQAKTSFTTCLNTAGRVNDPSNTANLALMKSVSSAYVALADAALAMYDGSDVFSTGRAQMNAGQFAAAAGSLQSAGDRFQNAQALFSQATTTLQGVSYAGTSFGDGTAYTAAIVPVLNGKGAYMGEFAIYARGWQHTALAYQASANGDLATSRSEGVQAMNLFGSLRTSTTFGADATSNYNILAGLLGSAPPTQRPRYIVGVDGAYPPYSYVQSDGTITGFDVESARWIADRMGFDVTFVAIPWDGIIPVLQSKRIDMIYSGMSITEERKTQVAFSKPYIKFNQSAAIRADSAITMGDVMAGTAVIGVQRGTTGELWVRENLINTGRMPAAHLKSFDNFPLAFAALLNGQVDVTIYDRNPTVDLVSGKNARILAEIDTKEEYGIAVRKEDAQLLDTLNRGLDQLMADPYWNELKKKYKLEVV